MSLTTVPAMGNPDPDRTLRQGLPAPDPTTLVAAAPEVMPDSLWFDATYGGHVVVTGLAELPSGWTVEFDLAWPEADYTGPLPSTVWLRDWHRFMIPLAPTPMLCSWCSEPATSAAGVAPACDVHAASYRRHPATDDTPPWGSGRPNLVLIDCTDDGAELDDPHAFAAELVVDALLDSGEL